MKKKFSNENTILLFLISSIICLSPYYRTSGFWGLEENFGSIFILLSFLSLHTLLKITHINNFKNHLFLFSTTFLSSSCLYFDQKLIIIPLICFIRIITSDKIFKLKILTIFYYILFALPYVYLIFLWGGLIPAVLLDPVSGRKLGNEIFPIHVGYAMTMIAFYLLPMLFFKNENILSLLKDFFKKKKNYFSFLFLIFYLIYIAITFDFDNQINIGKGFIHKISLMFFDSNLFKILFTYFAFIVSWIIILVYIENKFVETITILYLLVLSLFISPIFQEYFDPLILIMVFTFFKTNLKINFKNSAILYIYMLIFLISTNIYYANILN